MPIRDLSRDEYPPRLVSCPRPPKWLAVAGNGDFTGGPVVAIVGSRRAAPEALRFAHELAFLCAKAGGVVVSGGALGVDSAAHRGALEAGGRTWAILGTNADAPTPAGRDDLFAEIQASPSSLLVWPFPRDRETPNGSFLRRNGYLVALADAVVVVQASESSGSLNSVLHARRTEKPLWIVPVPPWLPADEAARWAGNRKEIEKGNVRILMSKETFLLEVFGKDPVEKLQAGGLLASAAVVGSEALGVRDVSEDSLTAEAVDAERSPDENALLAAATNRPKHLDDLCEEAGLAPHTAATALLTLALEHVLVEGPPGFYRKGLPR